MAISIPDRKKLRDRAGGECSFAECGVRESLVEAHIVANKPDGPRGDPAIGRPQLDSYDNIIVLCPNHHTVVDANPGEWTVGKLEAMKTAHERDVAQRLAHKAESTIVLGEPMEYSDEYANRTHLVPDSVDPSSSTRRPDLVRSHKESVNYRLFRVPVTSEGRDATDVFVQLAESTPPLPSGLPSAILHLAGDNPEDHVSFNESRGFILTAGVARWVDVIAITKSAPYRCFIFKIASADAIEEHNLDGEYIFRLASIGGGTRDYRVQIDLQRGTLLMEAVVATESSAGGEYWLEPGAPIFRVNPGVDTATAETVKLLMTFAQTSGDDVKPVIEWAGAHVEPSQPLMMPENQPPGATYQKYQLRPAVARPTEPEDVVTFAIRFRWQGATRQYRWSWPLYMREKGIWGMNNVAENTLEPMERTTID